MSVGPRGSRDARSGSPTSGALSGGQQNNSQLSRTISIQAQLDLNDLPEYAGEPGPGHYFGPGSQGFSAMGEQRFAKSPSAPEMSFPRTGWDDWSKVLISKGHSNSPAFLGKQSVGPGNPGVPSLSKKAIKMGTSLRPDLSLSLGIDPHGSPGPAYNVREIPGQGLGEGGSFETVPNQGRLNKGQGLAPRFEKIRGGSIGPGHYPRKDTALDSNTGRSIGTGRGAWEKVVTPGWECEGRCRASPGPGPPLWSEAKKDGSRSYSLGRAERFPRSAYESCSPGPAAYDQNERRVGKSRQHVSDTRSPKQAHFGSKPTKPRFRMVLAMKTSERAGWGYF